MANASPAGTTSGGAGASRKASGRSVSAYKIKRAYVGAGGSSADVRSHQQIKGRPIDRSQEEKPHLLSFLAKPYDTARVLCRTVNSEGHVMYMQNFYSVPWQRIGELLPVRSTEKELIVYSPDVREIARHELYPSGIMGRNTRCWSMSPHAIISTKYELLKERFAEFGPDGVLFFDELIRTHRWGKATRRACWACWPPTIATIFSRISILGLLNHLCLRLLLGYLLVLLNDEARMGSDGNGPYSLPRQKGVYALLGRPPYICNTSPCPGRGELQRRLGVESAA
jgi:hypothetical protein